MAKDFYTEWLRIPAGRRPPDHYGLLGVPRFCRDQDAIETAARARLSSLDQYAMHPDRATRDAVQDMMDEVAQARVSLINSQRQQAYDEELARALGVSAPAVEEAVEELPAPKVEAGKADETVGYFEARVWAHLRKWKLNPQEERLLVAEAAELGVSADQARGIIHEIDRQAEARAEKKGRRTTMLVVALGVAGAAALVVTTMLARSARAERETAFETGISEARACLAGDDLEGARRHLAGAGEVFPKRPELQTLSDQLNARQDELAQLARQKKRFEACLAEARAALDAGDFQLAAEKLAQAEQFVSNAPKTGAIRAELEAKRKAALAEARGKHFDACMAAAQAATVAGDFQLAETELAKAEKLLPNDPRPATLRADLDAKRKAALAKKAKRQSFDALLAEAEAAFNGGDMELTEAKLAHAGQLIGDDSRLAGLRGKVKAKREALLAQKRGKEFRACLAEARAAVAGKDFELAEKKLAEAGLLVPGDPDLAALTREMKAMRELATWMSERDKLSPELRFEATLEKLREISGDQNITGQYVTSGNQGPHIQLSGNVVSLAPLAGLQAGALRISKCPKLKSLSGIEGMPLKSLDVYAAYALTDLKPLKGMKLKSLRLRYCRSLKGLASLEGIALKSLDVSDSSGLTDLKSLNTSKLKSLNVRFCGSLKSLTGLEGAQLESLDASYCSALADLKPLKGMKLKTLKLRSCGSLASLAGIERMPLTQLDLASCKLLTSLEPLRGIRLKSLDLSSCKSLKSLAGLEGMRLDTFNASDCTALTDLRPLRGMKLTSLKLSSCTSLASLAGIDRMPLKSLDITDCASLTDLKPLRGMKLTSLSLRGCKSLASLMGIERLPLTDLDLTDCESLTSLLSLRGLKLDSLDLVNCKSLKSLAGMERVPVTYLDLSGCESLTTIWHLRSMKLESLELDGCKSLKSLSGISGMPLYSISVEGCEGLKPAAFEQLKTIRTLTDVDTGDRDRDKEIEEACRKLRGRTPTRKTPTRKTPTRKTPRRKPPRRRTGDVPFEILSEVVDGGRSIVSRGDILDAIHNF